MKDVLVGGELKPNPYIERDKDNKRILSIYARSIAFRYSSKGLPMVVDWTTIFDVPSYRMIDLLAKAKDTPQAFKLLPVESQPPKEAGTWAKYDFDESTKLWINTSNEEALTWYSQIIHREKKAIDFAQTFSRRNALKHLSGLQQVPGQVSINDKGYKKITPIPEWNLEVYCWRPLSNNIIKWDTAQYIQLQNRVEAMISGDEPVQITQGAEDINPEIIDLEETDPEDDQPEPDQEQEAVQEQEAPATKKEYSPDEIIYNNFCMAQDSFPEEFKEACKNLNLSEDKEFSVGEMKDLYKEVNSIIDNQGNQKG